MFGNGISEELKKASDRFKESENAGGDLKIVSDQEFFEAVKSLKLGGNSYGKIAYILNNELKISLDGKPLSTYMRNNKHHCPTLSQFMIRKGFRTNKPYVRGVSKDAKPDIKTFDSEVERTVYELLTIKSVSLRVRVNMIKFLCDEFLKTK